MYPGFYLLKGYQKYSTGSASFSTESFVTAVKRHRVKLSDRSQLIFLQFEIICYFDSYICGPSVTSFITYNISNKKNLKKKIAYSEIIIGRRR